MYEWVTGHVDLWSIHKNVGDFTAVRLELDGVLPGPGIPFGISLQETRATEDILIHRIERITSRGRFSHLKCEYMVDENGLKRAVF